MARVGWGKHATQVDTSTYPDDGTSPIGSNEWNEAPSPAGMLGFTESTKTISSGAIIPVDTATIVAAESGITDDLDFITYSETSANDVILLYSDSGDTITVRHNQSPGSGQAAISTTSAASVALSATVPLVLQRRGTTFYQIIENSISAITATSSTTLTNKTINTASNTITVTATDVSDFDTEVANNSAVTANTAKTGISSAQASAITANTAKVTYPSADSTKLAGIEASATADQTNAEIAAAVEAATDSNTFTDADHTKLNAIEASATADQSNAEIRTAVEAATDSNVFTDADHSKLNAIEASADVTDTTNVNAAAATTVGTITSGTWQGTTVAVNQGGTGVTTSTGTGSTVLSASPTLTGTVNAADITLSGNLIVNGTSTTVDTATLTVEDPLIKLASGNDSADSVDVGFYGLYDVGGTDKYSGIVRDASDGKFIAFKDLQTEPTTTVDKTATGYTKAVIVADIEGNVTGTVTGNASGLSATLAVASGGTGVTAKTGTGNVVLSTSPTLVTPVLGTPASGALTNCTALPAAQVSQGTMASGMVLVAPVLGTPASGALTNCTALPAAQVSQGTMASGMVMVAPVLGTPASGALTNCTALPAAQVAAGTMASGHTIPDPTLTFSINAQTGTTYTPVLADSGKIVTLNNGSAITLTIPPNSSVAYPVGSSLTFISIGAGLTTFAQGTGVTIASVGGTATAPIITAQHGSATAIKIATDTWQVVGGIE